MESTELELYLRRPIFSLEAMSILRFTTTLCNHPPLLQLIMECEFQKRIDRRLCTKKGHKWAVVRAMAENLVSQICNCAKYTGKIMEFFWPVCHKILRWKSIYAPAIENKFLGHFYWTDQGKVDTVRTARYLLGNKNICVKKRFVLACSVCLEEEMYDIWVEMPVKDRMYFYEESRGEIRHLLLFWAHSMIGDDIVLVHFVNDACACAFNYGLFEAFKYFFDMFSEDDKRRLAHLYTGEIYHKLREFCYLEQEEIDICYFLFLQRGVEDESNVFDLPTLQLMLLLHFSDSEHFQNALKNTLQYSALGDIQILLNMIFLNYHIGVIKSHDYREIFVEMWEMIPASMKRVISVSDVGGQYISFLIRDNFAFIFGPSASIKIDKLTSVSTKLGKSVMPSWFHQEKWEFLHFLVQKEIATTTSILVSTEKIRKILRPRNSRAAWKRFWDFVEIIGCKSGLQEK